MSPVRPPARLRSTRALLVTLVAASSAVVVPPPASAQGPQASLRLVRQPLWHEPGQNLGIRLGVTNSGGVPLDGFQLTVNVYGRVGTRSELHASLRGEPGAPLALLTKPFEEAGIAPAETRRVTLDDPLDSLPVISGSSEGGVFPVQITLYHGTEQLDTLITPVMFYPTPREVIPLDIVPVLPLHDTPHRGPDGVFRADGTGTAPLEVALEPGGWLQAWLEALEEETGPQPAPATPPREDRDDARGDRKRPRPRPEPPPRPLHLAIAPTPRLLEELADMASGYTRVVEGEAVTRVAPGDPRAKEAGEWLSRLEQLLGTPGIQPMLSPYAFPDLPSLATHLPQEMDDQIAEGQAVLRETVGAAPDRDWMLLPGARMDADTLETLHTVYDAAGKSFFAPTSVRGSGREAGDCSESFASFTCPIELETTLGPTSGFLLDRAIQRRLLDLTEPDDDRLDLQNLFAETAMIHAELPGVQHRVVAALIPSMWHPSRGMARLVLRGLAEAPWLRSMTPKAGLRRAADPVPRRLVDEVAASPDELDETYYEDVAQASARVESFGALEPPAGLLRRLERNILVAQSRAWWEPGAEERGLEYARRSVDEVEGELAKVTLGGATDITLTSRRGAVEVIVFNDTGYPITANLELESPKLEFTRPRAEETVPPGTQPLRLNVTAQASGIFSAEARLVGPDGEAIATRAIRIRSTEFNEIALGITFGAFAFLVLWYVVRAVRRRSARAGSTAA